VPAIDPLLKVLPLLELTAVDCAIGRQQTLTFGKFGSGVVTVFGPLTLAIHRSEDGNVLDDRGGVFLRLNRFPHEVERRAEGKGEAGAVNCCHTVFEYPICIHRRIVSDFFLIVKHFMGCESVYNRTE